MAPFPLTGSGVRLVTRPGDLSSQLHLVTRLIVRSSVRPQSDHATSEARQVTHLVLQESALPFGDIRQPSAWLTDQILFNSLRTKRSELNWYELKMFLNWCFLWQLSHSVVTHTVWVEKNVVLVCIWIIGYKGDIERFRVISFHQKRHENKSRPLVRKMRAEIRVTAVCQ